MTRLTELKMRIVIFFLLLLHPAIADFTLKTIILMDSAAFSVNKYSSILTQHFVSSASVTSVQGDSMTGAVARKDYFPNRTDIPIFQVLHITRVQATLRTDSNEATMNSIIQLLPNYCADVFGPTAIDFSPNSDDGLSSFVSISPLVLPIIIAAYALTLCSCCVCWFVECCCFRAKQRTQPQPPKPTTTIIAPTAPPLPSSDANYLPPPPPLAKDDSRRRPPAYNPHRGGDLQPNKSHRGDNFQPNNGLLAMMRLPMELQGETPFANQFDPYEESTPYLGPASVRLASWPVDPSPPLP